ncbi:retron system putative HNH endonuclease [Pseudomonas caspiana]|uniref:retron system putative HNH endonuclease n=1 Tax=Pseudomonas caspiana TaxID=1451454 RepID=UPI0032ED5DE0
MRKIEKGGLAVLETWMRRNPGARYQDLVGHGEIKDAIREACVVEQNGLCAYCCRGISAEKKSSHNEHVEAQDLAPNRTLDFQNIVASCNKSGRCGEAHRSQPLPLTPLMDECETELQFELSGAVEGLTERAHASIRVLNLNNRGLRDERRAMVDTLLYSNGGLGAAELRLTPDDLLDLLLDDLRQVDCEQKLQAFSPVLVNVIQSLRA